MTSIEFLESLLENATEEPYNMYCKQALQELRDLQEIRHNISKDINIILDNVHDNDTIDYIYELEKRIKGL